MKTIVEAVTNGLTPLFALVLLPALAGLACFFLRKRHKALRAFLIGYAVLQALLAACAAAGTVDVSLPLTGGWVELAFSTGGYQSVFLLLTGVMFALVSVYTAGFTFGKSYAGRYGLYLHLSLGMLNGAMLSDNLACMLFFWEGLLCTLFLTLLIGNVERPGTAVKALVISGTADLLLMAGIIITGVQFGTLSIGALKSLPATGAAGLGFILMFLGAVGKAGCLPFHSWIPDAAADAPLPFMAAFPGALEKLIGMYFAVRLVSDMFAIQPGSGLSTAMLALGAAGVVLPVAMALVQDDMKKFLAYDAVSQVGYMVIGIGSCLPVGIVGALFHMLNNAVYKTGLFMAAGAVEKRTGTTDITKLGGLYRKMPVTAVSFVLCGFAVAGVPLFAGFFSKELIFDAALESGVGYYAFAVLGAFLTAVGVLKIGNAVFFGKERLPANMPRSAPEAHADMLVPMGVLGLASLALGLFNRLPADNVFGKALGLSEHFGGWPHSMALVLISAAVLLLAAADHAFGMRRGGSAAAAADHIRRLPGVRAAYDRALSGALDPYRLLTLAADGYAWVCVEIERGVSWFYDSFCTRTVRGLAELLSRIDNGNLARYIGLALLGVLCLAAAFIAARP